MFTLSLLIIGMLSNVNYEQKELRLIKLLLRSDKKEVVVEFIKRQLKGLKNDWKE